MAHLSSRTRPDRRFVSSGTFKQGHAYVGRPPQPIPDRFWPKVDKVGGPVHPIHGLCWVWTGNRNPRTHYAMFKLAGSSVHAHRVSWALEHGPIPGGLWVLHRCDNRQCVRPAHLFLGTLQDNVDDMNAKGRNPFAMATMKRNQTHCIAGHAFDDANTSRRANGGRKCRACDARRHREARAASWSDGTPVKAPKSSRYR